MVGLTIFALMLLRILQQRDLLRFARPSKIHVPVKAIFALAIPSLTGTLVYLSMNTGSVILLSTFWGASEIARYRAVFPVARLNQFVYTAFSTLYLPMAARLFARGDIQRTRDAYWHTAALLLVFSFPVFAMTTVFAPLTTVTLFGERYADSSSVLLVLSIGFYCNVALGFNASTLVVFGRGRRLILVNAMSAALNLLLSLLLIPELGAIGVAIANCCTLIVQNALNQWGIVGILGAPLVDKVILRVYVWIALAVGGLVALDWLLSPGLILSVVLVLTATLVLLLLTRRQLRLADTFPELKRSAILRPFLG
jgi:O-antigen/teichoic acid export membrane protein